MCIGGAIFSCLSLVLSTFSPNVGVLMLTYGVMGGFGAGCIYLPSVIICGYYFEKKRALATGKKCHNAILKNMTKKVAKK